MPEREHLNADRKVFEAKRSASSVTGESKAVEGLVEGRHITVVDTPGMSHPIRSLLRLENCHPRWPGCKNLDSATNRAANTRG